MNRLGLAFNDKDLEKMRLNYVNSLQNIKQLEENLSDLKAHENLADGKEREKIFKEIDKTELNLKKEIENKDQTILEFLKIFSDYGVVISSEQAEVLLSRVDSGDITKMTSVFAVIAELTKQFAEAKQATGENTSVAQKYYAMYIGLLEVQEVIQTEYIDRMDKIYLPGINEIKTLAEKLIAETKILMRSMPDEHQSSYNANLKSQEFTIEVANVYEDVLRQDKAKTLEARGIVKNLHKLAENTLKTVTVSAELVSLMKESQGLYNEVMQLQTPDLVPFENLELKREFEAVTLKMQKH